MKGARQLFARLAPAALVVLLAACAGAPPVVVDARPPVASTPRATPPAGSPSAGTRVAPPATTSSAPSVVLKRGGGFYKDDGPGDNPPQDLAAIPDAEPQAEPLHPFANRPYNALGQDYVPMKQVQPYSKRGIASWYGKRFNGKRTSSGEPYDMYAMTGAHPTLPIPSYVRVTNVSNDRTVVVRINDRGPFHSSRLIDLSYTAAWKLGYVERGSAEVLVEAIVPDEMDMVVAQFEKRPVKKKPAEPVASAAPPAPPPKAELAASADVATTPPAVEPATPVAAGGGVYLQLGAFATLANANHFRDYVLGELKWLTQNLSSQFGGDKYRLHLGPFQSLDEARSVAEKIALAIKLKPFLVMK